MLSIKEMVDKTEVQRKAMQELMESTPSYFDHDRANLLMGQSKADAHSIMETLRTISLKDIMKHAGPALGLKTKEFLASSGTSGLAGAIYLIPEKIYQIMFDSAVEADICDQISIAIIPPDQIPGQTLRADIAVDDSYIPHKYSSGGAMPTETIKTTKNDLDFTTCFGINFRITNDLIEDSQFDLIEMHLRNAGREMGEYASNLAVTELVNDTGGDGTKNAGWTGTADVTKWAGEAAGVYDVETAIDENIKDGYVSDTLLISHHVMLDLVMRTVGTTAALDESAPWIYHCIAAPEGGWPTKMFDLNIVYSEVPSLTHVGETAYENVRTVVFDKDYALLTGRKRWLRIEKYSDPIRDLIGATVTARQDSITVYNDAACVIKET